jgi:pimeloyl-ACP methyl ester carboxylesterase
MQRPILDFKQPDPVAPPHPLRRLFARIITLLFSDPLTRRRNVVWVDEVSLSWRITKAILYRLALLPPLAMLIAATLVYLRTHPAQSLATLDPLSVGVYFESVNLITDDHVRLDAWLAPALDARQVVVDRDKTLAERWPAVVLVHGFGMSRQQVLPLFRPLHDAGFVVLAVGTRGTGSLTSAGQTFGLNETLDVKAAVELLRRRPYVDGRHIAVVGIGSGANAALLAADRDPAIAAIVLDAPCDTGDQALANHVAHGPAILAFMNPLCRWAFTIGYGLDVRDLDVDQYGHVLASRPSLLMRWSADAETDLPAPRVDQMVDFLDRSLTPPHQQAQIDSND